MKTRNFMYMSKPPLIAKTTSFRSSHAFDCLFTCKKHRHIWVHDVSPPPSQDINSKKKNQCPSMYCIIMFYYRHHPNLGALWDLHNFQFYFKAPFWTSIIIFGRRLFQLERIAKCIAIPSIESIYQASDLDVKLSCLLHLYEELPTASISFWS